MAYLQKKAKASGEIIGENNIGDEKEISQRRIRQKTTSSALDVMKFVCLYSHYMIKSSVQESFPPSLPSPAFHH